MSQTTDELLTCGHMPSPHGEHTTGYGECEYPQGQTVTTSVHFDPWALLARVRRDTGGFFADPADIAALAGHERSRLWPVLVRCGGGRFTCATQDVRHFLGIIERDGADYVRDVSLIAGQQYR